jgi:hypothetical protein
LQIAPVFQKNWTWIFVFALCICDFWICSLLIGGSVNVFESWWKYYVLEPVNRLDLSFGKGFPPVTSERCNSYKPSYQNCVVEIIFSNFVSQFIWTVRSDNQQLWFKTVWNCVILYCSKSWSLSFSNFDDTFWFL